MNRHCIFLSFFIIFSGTVVFSSCAKKAIRFQLDRYMPKPNIPQER